MAFELSAAQRRVVEHRNGSLLVAAAAGSGKTAVLVRRIIEKITGPEEFSLSRMLIVTFTNAAAAEMRERIAKAVTEELEKDPGNEKLLKAASEVTLAEICTIDSFCNRVVKDNFNICGIDPGFVIGDENELELLSQDILTDIFEEEYEKAADDFMAFMKTFGSFKDDSQAKEIVVRTSDFADSLRDPYGWLDKVQAELMMKGLGENIFKAILDETRKAVFRAYALNEKALAICKEPDGPEVCISALMADQEQLDMLKSSLNGFTEASNAFNSIVWEKWSSVRKVPNPDKKAAAKLLRDKSKQIIDDIKEQFFKESPEKITEAADFMKPATLGLVRVTREYMDRLLSEKKSKAKFSFSDIEHFAYEILCVDNGKGDICPTDVAREMAKGYDEIMIDEYQDSTILQEYILKSVSGEVNGTPNLFMVGDVKQSIYSFRRAKPELFNEKYRSFERVEGKPHVLIDLNMNYRSRKAVLDSVNVLMAGLMTEEATGIEYADNAALHCGRISEKPDTAKNNTEVILIEEDWKTEGAEEAKGDTEPFDNVVDSEPDEKFSTDNLDARQREAFIIGERILRLVREENYQFRDICILTRAKKGVTEMYTDILGSLGIPARGETGMGYFSAVEVDKTLSFLRILDNPYQDIYFAAVLYSPIANITLEELAEIKIYFNNQEKQQSLYEMCREYAGQLDKLQVFFRLFDELKELSRYMTVHEILEEFYEKTNYLDIVSIQPKGEKRKANLLRLVSYAMSYENSSYTGIGDFVRYVDRLIQNEKDMGEANVDAEENVVKLLTIHKSKGLEFPVVFLAQTTRGFNDMDMRNSVVFSENYGIAANVINPEKRTKKKSTKRALVLLSEKQDSRAEETRMLYVALTRAKEKLIITGSVSGLTDEKKYAEKLMQPELSKCNCYMDMCLYKFLTAVGDRKGLLLACDKVTATITEKLVGESEPVTYAADFDIKYVNKLPEVVPYDGKREAKPIEAAELSAANSNEHKEITNPLDYPGVKEEIKIRKEFSYPYMEVALAPVKVSVSELKHKAMNMSFDEDAELSEPTILKVNGDSEDTFTDEETDSDISKVVAEKHSKPKFTGAERGTLYHETLEKLRYQGNYSEYKVAFKSVITEMEDLINEGLLSKEAKEAVNVNKITAFTQSSIGKRMIEACKDGTLNREQPFVYGLTHEEFEFFAQLPATEVNAYNENQRILLQGIIDAYIDAPDGITLVDYKTDSVKNKGGADELIRRYKMQMDLYSLALTKITGKKVKERIIYSLDLSQGIEV